MAYSILAQTRPCKKCGLLDKYEGGRCKPCTLARAKAWNEKNKEKRSAMSLKWRTNNKDKEKAGRAIYRAANKNKINSGVAAWAEANKARKKASVAVWRAANVERERSSKAAWYAANKDKKKAYSAKRERENPEARRIINQTRRALKKASGGKLSKGLVEKLFKLQGGMCPCCSKPLGGDYHVDHKIPLSRGGMNTDENIQLLRKTCNLQKASKHPIQFMQERGFLL